MLERFYTRLLDVLNGLGNVALVAVVLVLGLQYVRRPSVPEVPSNWADEMSTGLTWGNPNGALKIVEFIDLQCPFCRTWHARLDSLRSEYPDRVQVTLHHFPLSGIHPHAIGAAVALECGARQGRAEQIAGELLMSQSEFGTVAWSVFGTRAGVPDSASYGDCLDLPTDSFPRIAYGIDLARANALVGTPTVWIDGVMEVPSLSELRSRLR